MNHGAGKISMFLELLVHVGYNLYHLKWPGRDNTVFIHAFVDWKFLLNAAFHFAIPIDVLLQYCNIVKPRRGDSPRMTHSP